MESKQGGQSGASNPLQKNRYLIVAIYVFVFLAFTGVFIILEANNIDAPEPSKSKSDHPTDLDNPIKYKDISVTMTSVKIELSEHTFYKRGTPINGIIVRGAITCDLPTDETCRIKNAGAFLWLGREALPLEFILNVPEEIVGGRNVGFKLESSSISQERERRLPISLIEFQIMLEGEREYRSMWFDTGIEYD